MAIGKSVIIALGLAAISIGVTAECHCDDNGVCVKTADIDSDTADDGRRRAMNSEPDYDGECQDYYTQFVKKSIKATGGMSCCNGTTTGYRRYSVCYPLTEIESIEIGWDRCFEGDTFSAAIYQLDRSADMTVAEMGDPIWQGGELVCEQWDYEYPVYIDVDWDDSVESNYDDCRDIVIAITWESGPYLDDGNWGLCNFLGTYYGDVTAESYYSGEYCAEAPIDPITMSEGGFDAWQFIIGFYACHGAYTPLECAVDDGVCGCDECKVGCKLERKQCTDDKKSCRGTFVSCIHECDVTHSDCKSEY